MLRVAIPIDEMDMQKLSDVFLPFALCIYALSLTVYTRFVRKLTCSTPVYH